MSEREWSAELAGEVVFTAKQPAAQILPLILSPQSLLEELLRPELPPRGQLTLRTFYASGIRWGEVPQLEKRDGV